MLRFSLTTILAVTFYSGGAMAQDVVFTGTRINHTETPMSIGDFTREMLDNDTVKTITLEAVEKGFGVPSLISSQVWEITKSSPVVKTKGSENRYTDFPAPPGYVICKATVSDVSFNPPAAIGSEIRRGDMGSGHLAHGLTVYTWAKKENLGGGRNWISADIKMMWVKPWLVERYECMPHRHRVYDRKKG